MFYDTHCSSALSLLLTFPPFLSSTRTILLTHSHHSHSSLPQSSPLPHKNTLTGAHLFRNLSVIGNTRSLDYLSRLAATSLGFTDGGHLSRYLIQLWSSPKGKYYGIFVLFLNILLSKWICLISLWVVVVMFCLS